MSYVYESALKAFKSILEDDHSGHSVMMTKTVLNRLIDGKCLTPIEDTDDIWNEVSNGCSEDCARASSISFSAQSFILIIYSPYRQ